MVWMIIIQNIFCIKEHLYRVFKPKITQIYLVNVRIRVLKE